MADHYTWNEKHSIERIAIEGFLSIAYKRCEGGPIPLKAEEARLAIGWLRALLDRKPSELNPQ